MSDHGPRWTISYRPALGQSSPASLIVEANNITEALKIAQMTLFEMDGAWKITGITRMEDTDPPPPASVAMVAA